MEYEIKNWSEFQQYKDDRPMHWIKLHVSLLDDYRFDGLSETEQLTLIKLWLFAAKSGGKIEGSEDFLARKIGMEKININNLLQSGFIVRTSSYESVPREEKRREEERREEERREREEEKRGDIMSGKPDDIVETVSVDYQNEASKEILDVLNSKTNSNYRNVDSNLKLIKARLNQGFKFEEIIDVIDMKVEQWTGTKFEQYLRPSTLFNDTKFNQYVGELKRWHEDKSMEVDW